MYNEIKDYGFLENDVQFLFCTTDDKEVSIKKNRDWFFNHEAEEMDYKISYTILVNKEVFMNFPDSVDRTTVENFANMQFEIDEEATDSLEEMHAIYESERRLGA